jgi:hypothetical protein
MKSIRRVTREELQDLITKKGFQLCQRITRLGLRFLKTQLLLDEMNVLLYIYDYIYPYVKELLLEYRQTFEYRRRLAHSLVTAVAAFFSRLQDDQRITFAIQQFHEAATNNRDIVITLQ